MLRLLAITFSIFIILLITLANIGIGWSFFNWVLQFPAADKIWHFFSIGLLTLLVNLAFQNKQLPLLNRTILLGSMILVVVTSMEELSQIFISNRNFEILDLVCNYAGILIFGKVAVHVEQQAKSGGKTIPV